VKPCNNVHCLALLSNCRHQLERKLRLTACRLLSKEASHYRHHGSAQVTVHAELQQMNATQLVPQLCQAAAWQAVVVPVVGVHLQSRAAVHA
jgi:hypothetical protein